jgi:hypothetical protein
MASTESVSHDDLVVCACEGQEFTARDAIHAALFRGDLEEKWQDFLGKVEAEKYADKTEMELDDAAFDAAAEAFRYHHDLITAEETEHWLESRALSLDDFGSYFARQCWGHTLKDKAIAPKIDFPTAPSELRDLFTVDLILSGELDTFVTHLSWRLAARCAAKEHEPAAMATEEKTFLERNKIKPPELTTWLQVIGRDRDWLDLMLQSEIAYRERRAGLLIPQTFQRELVTLRLPLTRFETEVIELESRDAAHEALFCVREDGMSMEEVAKEGRYPFRRDDFILDDLPDDVQQRFLSVAAGDVLEPNARGDGFELCRINKRTEPQPDDPAVQARIEKRILGRHFHELTSKHIEPRLGIAAVKE